MNAARFRRLLAVAWLAMVPAGNSSFALPPAAPVPAPNITLPRLDGSFRFAVIGDTGRGDRPQYETGARLIAAHGAFPFNLTLMVGDNIYGADEPADMQAKFTTPYKALLDAGVTFRVALGNHDNPNQRFFKPFGMDGQRYYSFPGAGTPKTGPGSVHFFAIDSTYLDAAQLQWLERELKGCEAEWRIAFFHHPLYSSGRGHGPSLESRAVLEPLFVQYGVSAAFSGHDHFYERSKPQKGGIVYWVSGAGGSLRRNDIRATPQSAKGFDTDYHFMILEIVGDDLHYQAISRTGVTVDKGLLRRPGAPAAP